MGVPCIRHSMSNGRMPDCLHENVLTGTLCLAGYSVDISASSGAFFPTLNTLKTAKGAAIWGWGGGAEELARKKVCFRYFAKKKSLFLTNNLSKIVLNMVLFEKKSLLRG